MTARKTRGARRGGTGGSSPRGSQRRPGGNRVIVAVVVVLAFAALYAAARFSGPAQLGTLTAAGPSARLPVTSALVACPGPGSGTVTGGGLAIASAPVAQHSGQALVTGLRTGGGTRSGNSVGATLHILTQPGQLKVLKIAAAPALGKHVTVKKMAGGQAPTTAARGGVVIQAVGAMAQGFDAEQLGPRGVASARCTAPGSDFWFVGPGGTKLHTELYLLNTDDLPADAAVGVQTDSGPSLGEPDSGIVVPAHGMVVQNLDKLLHSAKAVALHVTTSTGRVVAAVRETSKVNKAGTWLPAAAPPATRLVLPGMPGSQGTRELYLTVPGSGSAQVKVTAVTPRGSYQPTGGNEINLLSHETTGLALPSLGGIPAAVKISANVPVTAVIEVPGGPPGAPGAFVTGSGPIIDQGVVAASEVGKGVSTVLLLSAPQHAASVRITEALPGGALNGQSGQVVQVRAHTSLAVPIRLPKRPAKPQTIAIVVTPLAGSGPVYAARIASAGGTVQVITPVPSSPTQVKLPSVTESLVAVLR